MGKPVNYNSTLTERIDLTDKLAFFRVKPDPDWGKQGDGRIPDFEAGQYVVLGLNNQREPDKGSVLRSYSIASPPQQKDYLEFYIRYVDHPASDNPLTHLLWEIRDGDRIYLGPKITGHFNLVRTIGPDDPRIKVFVASGTGLAPFVSMVLATLHRGGFADRFAVLHGASFPADLAYADLLREVFKDLPDRYMATISRPHLAPDWTGDTGRVETYFSEEKFGQVERRLGLAPGGMSPERCVVYICGLQGTIQNTLMGLMRRGFVPSDRAIRKGLGLDDLTPSLFYEQYDSTPILDLKNRPEMESLLAQTPFASRLPGSG